MQELERYFKIYFDANGDKNNMGYYIEEKNLTSEFEYIPMLAQGYVRCLCTLKKPFFDHDENAVAVLRTVVREILFLSNKNIIQIKSHYDKKNNFDAIEFLMKKDLESETKGEFINNFFNFFYKIKNKEDITDNVNVKYEIKTGSKGRCVMYNVSIRMESYIQIQAYMLMLRHLLSRFKDFNSFLFFYNYMIETDVEIEKNNYTSILGMANIIKNASINFRRIVNQWEDKDNYDLLKVFCLPKF